MSRSNALIAELNKKVNEIDSLTSLFENQRAFASDSTPSVNVVEIEALTTVYVTTGNEDIIVCNNSSPLSITMTVPSNGKKITYIRRDAEVSLIGNINGSSPTSITSQYDILDVYYTDAAGEFSA